MLEALGKLSSQTPSKSRRPTAQLDRIVRSDGPLVESSALDLRPNPTRSSTFRSCARIGEYRLYSGRGQGWGTVHEATLPAGVLSGQLGLKAVSLIGILGMRFHLRPYEIRHLMGSGDGAA